MTAPRRGLVLAGGGMRVAWQTGVVAALDEHGLRFHHGDGTSGGIFTLAMLLSGQTPDEMGERWRDLDVRAFVRLLPLRAYLRSPTDWAAFGGSSGIRDVVLPGLGIDCAKVRAATSMTGSFNVADFSAKRCVPVAHTDIDEDRLVAGVSLAGVMPAVRHEGRTWTDAVWIKDANLTDAVTRGCTELWVAWCIANTPYWGAGGLEQYVHMIEMSANSALFAELAWIRDLNRRRLAGETVLGSTTPVTVHLVKPRLPIPLDPDFVAGRIDADTLVAMGYRDACAYLDDAPAGGVDLDGDPTATPARPLGARVSLRSSGRLAPFGEVDCLLVVEADDLQALVDRPGTTFSAVGTWRDTRHGLRMFATTTVLIEGSEESRRMRAVARLRLGDSPCELEIVVPLPESRPLEARTHQWTVSDRTGSVVGHGTGRMSVRQTLRTVGSFEPAGAHDLRDRIRALVLVARVLRGRRAATSAARTGPRRSGRPPCQRTP